MYMLLIVLQKGILSRSKPVQEDSGEPAAHNKQKQ